MTLKKLGESQIHGNTIELPDEVLDELIADDGDILSFYLKDGEIIIRRGSIPIKENTTSQSQPSTKNETEKDSETQPPIPDLTQVLEGMMGGLKDFVQKVAEGLQNAMNDIVPPTAETEDFTENTEISNNNIPTIEIEEIEDLEPDPLEEELKKKQKKEHTDENTSMNHSEEWTEIPFDSDDTTTEDENS